MIPFHIDDPPYIPCPCCWCQSTYFTYYPNNSLNVAAVCQAHSWVLGDATRITKAEYLALVLEAKL